LKIPDKVKVAGIEYKVEICKDYTDEMNEAEFRGKVFFKENKIKLLNSYSIDEKMRTLIHEVLHIIDDNSKIDMSEETIRRVSCGLYQVLKDNKLLRE